MIDKVALTEGGEITLEELSVLVNQLMQKMRDTYIPILRNLYMKLPDEYKHEGIIYRGIHLKKEKDAINLFQNRSFQAKDFRLDVPVESWSYSKDIAIDFSLGEDRKSYMGIVIQSNTSQFDVVGQYDMKIRNYLESLSAARDLRNDEMKAFSDYQYEKEVMVVNPGKVTYNLCEDVIYVILSNATLQRLIFEGGIETDAGIMALVEHLNDADREKFEMIIMSGDMNYHESNFMMFNCDGQGNLTMIQRLED